MKQNNESIELYEYSSKLSAKQPPFTGFGFIIHLPKNDFDRALSIKLTKLRAAGMIVKNSQPIFLRTKRDYVRLSFCYGDYTTAKEAFLYLSNFTNSIFKNWL